MVAVGEGGALPNGVASPPPRVDFSRMHRSSGWSNCVEPCVIATQIWGRQRAWGLVGRTRLSTRQPRVSSPQFRRPFVRGRPGSGSSTVRDCRLGRPGGATLQCSMRPADGSRGYRAGCCGSTTPDRPRRPPICPAAPSSHRMARNELDLRFAFG